MNKNDKKIIELRSQIKLKRDSLHKVSRFNPVTNCILELDGVTYNLNTLDEVGCISLLVKVQSLFLAADSLDLAENYSISGFGVGDWLVDLKDKLAWLSKAVEEKKLKVLEKKLTDLLSLGKKTELEIEELSKELMG